jgi:hypothetical protein
MLAFANVMQFFAHEFSGLRRRRFSLASVALGSFDGFFVGHDFLFPRDRA